MKTVLVLGGYGTFGRRIATSLVRKGISVIIAGRHAKAADQFVDQLKSQFPDAKLDTAIFDMDTDLSLQLTRLKPYVVINTCGPFQMKDYHAAQQCIDHKIHYIDLADGRDFVNGITALNDRAQAAGVTVISGASTVPGLSSAVIEHYRHEFQTIDSLVYGIAPAQKTPRGLATTQAVLSYLGKPLKPAPGNQKVRYGWQDTYRQAYPVIGKRWMANCDIPDIDLLPEHYGIGDIHFSAGMESSALHLSVWLMSWLVRLGLPLNPVKHAQLLLRASHWFDWFGGLDGGMHMLLSGQDTNGEPKTIDWFIIAKQGDGLHIPTIPAVVLAEKLLTGQFKTVGAMPCLGLVSLSEYLAELEDLDITVYER
jgi:saccharopine dehydrogenase-like NADP-dependent oxidoreductase